MDPKFNPYAKWLGIDPQIKTPNHYQLLGLELLASDRNQIDDAYRQRYAIVRKYQVGEFSKDALRLLQELSKAYDCLDDSARKAKYDSRLGKAIRSAQRESEEQLLDFSEVAEETAVRVDAGGPAVVPVPVADQWFYIDEGKSVGPVSSHAVRKLYLEGRVNPDCGVWQRGWKVQKTLRDAFPDLIFPHDPVGDVLDTEPLEAWPQQETAPSVIAPISAFLLLSVALTFLTFLNWRSGDLGSIAVIASFLMALLCLLALIALIVRRNSFRRNKSGYYMLGFLFCLVAATGCVGLSSPFVSWIETMGQMAAGPENEEDMQDFSDALAAQKNLDRRNPVNDNANTDNANSKNNGRKITRYEHNSRDAEPANGGRDDEQDLFASVAERVLADLKSSDGPRIESAIRSLKMPPEDIQRDAVTRRLLELARDDGGPTINNRERSSREYRELAAKRLGTWLRAPDWELVRRTVAEFDRIHPQLLAELHKAFDSRTMEIVDQYFDRGGNTGLFLGQLTSLGVTGEPLAISMLSHRDDEIVRRAAFSLQVFGTDRSIDPLLDAYDRTSSTATRFQLISSIRRISPETARDLDNGVDVRSARRNGQNRMGPVANENLLIPRNIELDGNAILKTVPVNRTLNKLDLPQITFLAFVESGANLITCNGTANRRPNSYTMETRCYDVDSEELVWGKQLEVPGDATAFCASDRLQRVAMGFSGGQIHLQDTRDGNISLRFNAGDSAIVSLSFDEANKRLVAGSVDGNIYVLNANTGNQINQFSAFTWEVKFLHVAKDGSRLIAVGRENSEDDAQFAVKCWSDRGAYLWNKTLDAAWGAPQVIGNYLLVGESHLRVLGAQRGNTIIEWGPFPRGTQAGALALGGRVAGIRYQFTRFALCDLKEGEMVGGLDYIGKSMAVSPDGKTLAVVINNNDVGIINLKDLVGDD